jgi:D-galactarolactone cycloisomerase
MIITDVEVYVLKTPLEQAFAFSQGWVRQRAATLVRVQTSNGLVGWGESFCQGLEPPEIAAATITHALTPLIMGEEAMRSGPLWHKMYHATRDYGRTGSVIAAISAIDIALWDIAGKQHGVPVCQLLGGAHRAQVQPYATGFYRIKGQGEAERLAAEAVEHREAGYSAQKIKLGFGVTDDILVMEAIRTALGDDDTELMVDTNHAYGRRDALKLGRALDTLNLRWYEEPVVPEDIDGYRELRQALDTPIAGGENEHTSYGFRGLLSHGALDVAQPDIASCGGFTAARDIAAMAQAHGVAVNPHVWGSAVAQAASLQWIASLPAPHHRLHPTEPVLEYDRSAHPFRREIVSNPIDLDANGYVQVPTTPGLGIDVCHEALERYRVST